MKLSITFNSATIAQTLAISAKNLVILCLGLCLGIPTVLIPGLLADNSSGQILVGEQEVTWIGSIFMAAVPIGSLLSGAVSNHFGRRRCLQIVNIPFIICWVTLYYSSEIWHIYLSLVGMGLFGGLVEAPFAAYMSEVTEPMLRGRLSSVTNISIYVGFLIEFLMGTFLHWRTVAILCTILPILSLIALSMVPESPHWLIVKGRHEDARKSLAWLRGWVAIDCVTQEYDEICEHLDQNVDISLKEKIGLFMKRNFVLPLLLALFVYFLGHFTGGTTLQTYSVPMFETLNVPLDKYYATLLLGVVQLLASCCLFFCIHIFGKRTVTFLSLGGICLSSVAIASYTMVFEIKYIIVDDKELSSLNQYLTGYEWIPLICFVTLSFTFSFGLYIMPWLLIMEIFPYETRSTGCGICSSLAYIFAFTSNKSFLYLVNGLYLYGVYILYACLSLIGVVVLYFTLPETEGKPLVDICGHFSGASKLSNNVLSKTSLKQIKALDIPNLPIQISASNR